MSGDGQALRILVAPDSFKGSLSALAAAEAMERGILAVFPAATVLKLPIADGGEGTVAALVAATGGQVRVETVRGPLGEPVRAGWGILGDGRTAVIEMAAASGLTLVPEGRRDPLAASSFGTGQLVRAALDQGMRKLILGLGGSATTDGGAGLAQALGARFLDENGAELPGGGGPLARLARVDLGGLDPRLGETAMAVACDVDNPLCGPLGAAAVYGPQKGASPAQVELLDAALRRFAGVVAAATGRDVADQPGAGAAGGMGAGLLFLIGARLRSGVEIVLEAGGFRDLVGAVDLVFTGEGRTDAQTAMGKAPVGVAAAAAPYGVPVICLSGGLGPGSEAVLAQGIAALQATPPGPMTLEACMASAGPLLEAAAARACRLLQVGRRLPPGALSRTAPG